MRTHFCFLNNVRGRYAIASWFQLAFYNFESFKQVPITGCFSWNLTEVSWVGKIPWRRKWQPTPVFLPGECHGQRSLVATVHGVTKSRQDWVTNTFLLQLRSQVSCSTVIKNKILFLAALGLCCSTDFSLVAENRGYSWLWCLGFSLWWHLLLQSTGSRVCRLQ